MLIKNIAGIIILGLNTAGLGLVLYLGFQSVVKRWFMTGEDETVVEEKKVPKKEPLVIDESLIPHEDELLKDMDLSDLDNLNLDDFE